MYNLRIINRLFGCAIIAASLFVNLAHATTLPIYSNSTIREWEPEFHAAIQDNYTRMFQPKLNNEEAQQLRRVRLDFPSDPESVLFNFHSRSDGTVVMPVASLLLLKDLATAQAWLDLSGYSAQTVLDYLSIIRQGRLVNWPDAERLPLQALGIPTDALKNQRVLEKRNDILDKSIFFILGHELGHLLQGFSAQADCDTNEKRGIRCDFQKLQKSESDADAFAVDMFRRMGLVPSSSNFFFVINSRLLLMPFEFKGELEWQQYAKGQKHPLDSARISNVAALIKGQRDAFARGFASPELGALKVDKSVNDLRILASLIDDRDLSGMQIAWAKSLEPEDIKPRHSHEPRLRPTKNDLAATQPLAGYFTGEAQYSSGGSAPLEVVMRVQGSGPEITGDVMLGGIRSRIEGRYSDPKHASATWIVAGDTYRLTIDADSVPGRLHVSYKSTTVNTATGQWALERKR